MTRRRDVLAGSGALCLASLAGCVGRALVKGAAGANDAVRAERTLDDERTATPTTDLSERLLPGAEPATPAEEATSTATETEPPAPPTVHTSLHHDRRRPTELRIVVDVDVSPRIERLSVLVPGNYWVATAEGLTPGRGSNYEWDGRTPTCRVELVTDVRAEVNEAFGGADYAGTESWLFAPIPYVHVRWAGAGDSRSTLVEQLGQSVDVIRDRTLPHVEVAVPKSAYVGERPVYFGQSPVYVGETSLFVGEHRTYSRTAAGQTFTLVVPEAASLSARPAEILDALAFASASLSVGERPSEVVVFVTMDPVRGGGLQMNDWNPARAEAWVHEDSRLDHPNCVWVHEYVHTRQALSLAPEMEWFREASAEYYAARLWWEQARAAAKARGDPLGAWNAAVEVVRHLKPRDPHASAVLDDESRWAGPRTPYEKGGWVLLALDSLVQRETGGRASLEAVFARLNAADEPTDLAAFSRAVADVAGFSPELWCLQYVSSGALPSLYGWWGRVEAHVEESADERIFGR